MWTAAVHSTALPRETRREDLSSLPPPSPNGYWNSLAYVYIICISVSIFIQLSSLLSVHLLCVSLISTLVIAFWSLLVNPLQSLHPKNTNFVLLAMVGYWLWSFFLYLGKNSKVLKIRTWHTFEEFASGSIHYWAHQAQTQNLKQSGLGDHIVAWKECSPGPEEGRCVRAKKSRA